MRVAVNVEQLLYHSPGGVGRYTAQVAGQLPATLPGVDMAPFTARHATADVAAAFDRAGVAPVPEVLALPRPLLYEAWHFHGGGIDGLAGPQRLARALRDVDLVHAPSVACPPRERVPLVVTVHDAAPVLFPEAYPRRGLRFHMAGLAAVRRRADLVLTVSEAAADEVASCCGIDPARITVVPHGVDRPDADLAGEEAVARAGLANRPYVLWVGSLEPRKGVGTLVAAMARLRRAGGPTARLVLVGPAGWLSEGIVADADRAVLGDDLVHLGAVPEAELWALYAAARLVAVPSRHEGFGLPVVEAFAAGSAVVASDIPALREVSGGAARLVPPTDTAAWAEAIGSLLADDAERAALVAAGRARAAALPVAASLQGTLAAYRSLL